MTDYTRKHCQGGDELVNKKRRHEIRVHEVRVITYNVLSSGLCEDSHFPKCNSKWLDPHYRLNQLKYKLMIEVKKKTIICLQEVSTEWACDLHLFFMEAGYYFIHALYGGKFGGYMGVGTAVPLEQYTISKILIDRVSDSIPNSLVNKDIENDPWTMAQKRNNQLLTVSLLIKGEGSEKGFNISNYHMPCMFRFPKVMLIHSTLSALIAFRHAQNARGTSTSSPPLPYILLGDFNITPHPDSYPYTYMTGSVAYPKTTMNNSTTPTTLDLYPDQFHILLEAFNSEFLESGLGLRSVYKEHLGAEPDFTNYAMVAWNSVPPAAVRIVKSKNYEVSALKCTETEAAFSVFNPFSWLSKWTPSEVRASAETGDSDPNPVPSPNSNPAAMEVVKPPVALAPVVETFCDTLDYIFLSKSASAYTHCSPGNSDVISGNWSVLDVIPLEHRDKYVVSTDPPRSSVDTVPSIVHNAHTHAHRPIQDQQTPGELGGPLPNEFECSDHVMLGCTLSLTF